MGVSKSRGGPLKMDGENNGKPYEQTDDFGGNTQISACFAKWGVTGGGCPVEVKTYTLENLRLEPQEWRF